MWKDKKHKEGPNEITQVEYLNLNKAARLREGLMRLVKEIKTALSIQGRSLTLHPNFHLFMSNGCSPSLRK